MKKLTLIYDPLKGHSVADHVVSNFVSQSISVFQKEGVFKSTFGNITIIQEFLTQIVNKNVQADLVEVIYIIGDKSVRTVVELV